MQPMWPALSLKTGLCRQVIYQTIIPPTVINYLAQFNSSYGPEHISGIKQIGYADADWAEEKDRKSISGNSFMMSGGAVSWSAKKQGLVALSTLEAEYISICHAMQHILWYQMMIQELRFGVKHPFNLNNDNHCTTALTHNPQFHGQSKHIDIHHHFIQELIKQGNIKVTHIQSLDNLADVFTKPLPEVLFKKFASTTIQGT